MLYGKQAKKFMEEHMKKMGPPQPTAKEAEPAPEWLAASPHYKPPKKEKPKPPTAMDARKKYGPGLEGAIID